MEIDEEEEAVRFESEFYTTAGNLMDSRTSQLDDLLIEKLEKAFHQSTSHFHLHDVAKIATEHDPIDLANAVTRLPPINRHVVYNNLPDRQAKVIFMINTDRITRVAILKVLEDREIIKVIDHMPTDEAVWLLDDLSDRRLKRILSLIEPKRSAILAKLLSSDRNSAARLMSNEFFAFPMHTTIGDVAREIRNQPGIDLTRRIFVLSDSGELIGYVPARNLIINPSYALIRQVMRPVQHTVGPEATRDEVVDLVERYKISALPVVDAEGVMQGVITYEDIVEVMEDIADHTFASIAGTSEDISEREPVIIRVFKRSPFLFITLCAGMITATTMIYFDGLPWTAFALFFIPLVNGMSGNVGIQSSSVLVRGMSTGEISSGERFEVIVKELSIGTMIGLFFGFLVGILVFVFNEMQIYQIHESSLFAGLTVACGVLGACFNASFFGTFFPFFFAKLGIDPAVSSGPFVTAFNDLLSTISFLLIAKILFTVLVF